MFHGERHGEHAAFGCLSLSLPFAMVLRTILRLILRVDFYIAGGQQMCVRTQRRQPALVIAIAVHSCSSTWSPRLQSHDQDDLS